MPNGEIVLRLDSIDALPKIKNEAINIGMKVEYSLQPPAMTGAIIRGSATREQIIEIGKITGVFYAILDGDPIPNYCFNCQGMDIRKEMKPETIPYGENHILTADIPVHTCNTCKTAWTDHEAGEIRDHVIQSHFAETKNKE